jgi:hypothetical protein
LGGKTHGRPRGTQKYNIVTDLREADCDGRSLKLAQDYGDLWYWQCYSSTSTRGLFRYFTIALTWISIYSLRRINIVSLRTTEVEDFVQHQEF